MRFVLSSLSLLAALALAVHALDNGVARTPPMGYNSWENFRCTVDCSQGLENCISAVMFEQMTDALVDSGLAMLGYNYVNLDDCWPAHERTPQGKLQGDPTRFPKGMKALGDYIHSKGLKYGIYEDYGTHTCGGYPGIMGHEQTDMSTFAEWGVDYLKLDGCYASQAQYKPGYTLVSQLLNATGRPIVFSCSWPAYSPVRGTTFNYTYIGEICNLWRLYNDIEPDPASLFNIIEFWGNTSSILAPAAAPGRWNDPDMLEVGNGGTQYAAPEHRIQMTMWSIFAAPLLISTDVRNMTAESFEILANTEIIAIDQDPMGVQGRPVSRHDGLEVWVRPLAAGDYAVALLNRRTTTETMTIAWSQLGLPSNTLLHVRDCWAHVSFGDHSTSFSVNVGGQSAEMLRLSKEVIPTLAGWPEYVPQAVDRRAERAAQRAAAKTLGVVVV